MIGVVAFRRWALANPREFGMCFANPIADSNCIRRELVTADSSGHFMTDLLFEVWAKYDFPVPDLDDLDPAVAEALSDPLIPAKVERIPDGSRGLLWIYMSSWAALYGVVTLEVFGHMDPRVIESGAMFVSMVREWMPRMGLVGEEFERLDAILVAEVKR